jgi:hypothetical protein
VLCPRVAGDFGQLVGGRRVAGATTVSEGGVVALSGFWTQVPPLCELQPV